MIPSLRRAFNAAWTPAKHAEFERHLHERVGSGIEFAVSETPCFFPRTLLDELASVGAELTQQALRGEAAAAAERVVPDRFHGPNQGDVPVFMQVDFGLSGPRTGASSPDSSNCRHSRRCTPFSRRSPTRTAPRSDLPVSLQPHLDGLTREEYLQAVGLAIAADHERADVVLMEIQPERQKTRPDFIMTEQFWGVRTVDTSDVVREGRQLLYRRDGRLHPIRRVYNRVIPDELETKQLSLPFDYRDELDVEWAGHPAWYFKISKFSIPWLRHPSVPRTWFLDQVKELPMDRDRLLLKPLFSFAGGGIVFAPTDEHLRAIPEARRNQYILQERIVFEPVIETPHGPTQAEIRIMFVWTDRLRPVLALVRMGRGKMMGVDHNKGLRWVGASAALMM